MSIDTYKLTSTEEPTDEVLSQLMREAAEEARETNAQATQRYFEELPQTSDSNEPAWTPPRTHRDCWPQWVWKDHDYLEDSQTRMVGGCAVHQPRPSGTGPLW